MLMSLHIWTLESPALLPLVRRIMAMYFSRGRYPDMGLTERNRILPLRAVMIAQVRHAYMDRADQQSL
jgi:hypothetical protein